MAAGDFNISHWLTSIIETKGKYYPFKYINKVLSEGDLIFSNLEAPFCEKGEPFPKNFVFKVPPSHVSVLEMGNINLVSIANNHILDYGMTGLIKTIETLEGANVYFAGAGKNKQLAYKPAAFEINSLRIAFFAYTMTHPVDFWATDSNGGTAYPYTRIVKDSISKYDKICDFVIVSFHWGKELHTEPDDYQIKYAHLAINAGADLILGHHPHILQGIEKYKDKYIFYSLGNFIFASYSNKATESILIDAVISKDGILQTQIIPINVNNYEVHFQPRVLKGDTKLSVIEHINSISMFLNKDDSIAQNNGFLR